MARYNRDFLIPYLHDLCALYLAEHKLENDIRQTKERIQYCSYEHYPSAPREPKEETISGGTWFVLIFGGFWIIGGLALMSAIIRGEEIGTMPLEVAWSMAFIALFLFGVAPLYFGINEYREIDKKNKNAQRKYEKSVDAYSRAMERAYIDNDRNAKQLPALKNQLCNQNAELERAQNLKRFVYGVNIIPTHYRNFYATVFLYDWFAHGISNDLDMALNTFVLEEIKERLDQIIEQQAEMILNQRLMLAKQQESIDNQNHHNDMMRRKLDRLQATEDEHLHYDRMIEANTAVTAFFAAATYLKS